MKQMLYIDFEHFRLYIYPKTIRKNCPNLGTGKRFLIRSVKCWVWSSRASGERTPQLSVEGAILQLCSQLLQLLLTHCHKLGGLTNNRNVFSLSFTGLKSWHLGPCPSHSAGEILFLLLPVRGSCRHFLAGGYITPFSVSVVTLLPGVCACVCVHACAWVYTRARGCTPNLSLFPSRG